MDQNVITNTVKQVFLIVLALVLLTSNVQAVKKEKSNFRATPEPRSESDNRGKVHFKIPPLPRSFADGSENNQEPPADLLAPVFLPKTFIATRDRADIDEASARLLAQTSGRQYLSDAGYSNKDSVITEHINADAYGGVHVKMDQRYENVPVIGGGFIVHIDDVSELSFSDYLIRGIALDTTPRITREDAIESALLVYEQVDRQTQASARLAILPLFIRERTGTRFRNANAADFEKRLTGNQLIWEVTVVHLLPEVDDEVLLTYLNNSETNSETDEDLREVRNENRTVGGNEAVEAVHEAFTTALTRPPMRYLIDALSGELLDEQLLVDQFDYTKKKGSGYGYYSGEVVLNTILNTDTNKHVLIDAARPASADYIGNIVFDAKNIKTHNPDLMLMMTDSNNSWGNGTHIGSEDSCYSCTARQTPAVDVAYGMQTTWDMLDGVFGRDGPKGNGKAMRACVHYDDGYNDAHYNGGSDFLCFGDGETPANVGNYGLGTVAHELGHAFWKAEGITDQGAGFESDALNEGHGDIQASFTTMYLNTNNGTGNQIKRLINFANWRGRVRNPESYDEDKDDKTYIGQRYWTEQLVDMPEHVGGLPFARAMIHLAQGASANEDSNYYTTEFPDGLGGIGVTRAALIWQHAMSHYIYGAPTYASMREGFIGAAKGLYGNNSMAHKAMQNAFAAIRVGAGSIDTAQPKFTYAKVFDINTTDLTAKILAFVDEDTGIRQVRVENHSNNGFYNGDIFYGYASLARAPTGQQNFKFEVEDSARNIATTFRSFVLPKNRNLIDNGDFEDGFDQWKSDSGTSHSRSNEERAFIGRGYLAMTNTDRVYQDVHIPHKAETATLVFRLLVRNDTTADDHFSVDLYDSNDFFLKNLANYSVDTEKSGRNAVNKGYIRHAIDLGAYAGQKIRIAFNNNTFSSARFYVDQVVLTYTDKAYVDAPKVELREWENTVSFELPVINGIENDEINVVQYYVGNEIAAISDEPLFRYFAGAHLHKLGPGPHWVRAVVRGHDNKKLAISNAVWFQEKPFNELLVNGGFESGPWDLVYSSPPPKVDIAENNVNVSIAFDGQKSLRMGSQGVAGSWLAGQLVNMPKQMKTLEFSTRIRMFSHENPDGNSSNNDDLYVELWNNKTFALIERVKLTHSDEKHTLLGANDQFLNYWREDVTLSPGKYAGKKVIVRFVLEEDNGLQTTYYIDNASLHYTHFGIGLPPEPPGPEL